MTDPIHANMYTLAGLIYQVWYRFFQYRLFEDVFWKVLCRIFFFGIVFFIQTTTVFHWEFHLVQSIASVAYQATVSRWISLNKSLWGMKDSKEVWVENASLFSTPSPQNYWSHLAAHHHHCQLEFVKIYSTSFSCLQWYFIGTWKHQLHYSI